ncbi:hypothetical protein K8M07_00645 [Schnuerera sp. xch1]|uniref:hypothetical protein n=1 Tax=Schnuerera sp. xch1 TaxID=2874283 RepID=UPI001CBEB0A6|nr:hypothetical protein [Schnuerera sp. xch1]MBZ2173758.1 hypothetical protein [Schnuerera sp. xch1]
MNKKEVPSFSKKYNLRWVIVITIWTFIMAVVFNIVSESLVDNLDVLFSFIILSIIIFIGVFFDIVGIAVTAAEEKPFHSMAANKVEESKYAIRLIRNAEKVSNFCNDVIGDISGIISGAVATSVIYKIIKIYDIKNGIILSIIITSLVAALTVGGKAFGKSVAILYSNNIIFKVALVLNFWKKRFKLDLLPNKKNNRN